jgi:hypothetical protein
MDRDACYEIQIEGQLDSRWVRTFEGMKVTALSNGDTLISGQVPDQAALHALLTRVRDLGAVLVLVRRVENS